MEIRSDKVLSRERLWTKDYILIIGVSLIVGTAIAMLMTTLPLYAASLGGSNTLSGMVVGVYAFSALLCRPFAGAALDGLGRKPVLIAGIAVLTVVFFFYSLEVSILILLVLRIIQGAGFSAHSTATGTAAADWIPKGRLSEGIGYFSITLTLPTAFGPALGLNLIENQGYGALFKTAFVLVLAGFVMALFIKDNPDRVKPQRASTRLPSVASLIERTALGASGIMLFIAMGLGGLITFIPGFGKARGIEGIGLFFTVYAVFLVASRLVSGRLADKAGLMPVAVPGLGLISVSFALLAPAQSLGQCLLSAALFGLGFGMVQPALNASVLRRCPPARKGAANATFTAAMDLGMGAGSILWGAVSQHFGFFYVYLFCAFFALAGLGLLFRQKAKGRI